MREGAEFRELMLQIVRTRMAFRRSMQRTLRKNNAGITFEMLQVLSSLWHEQDRKSTRLNSSHNA